MNLQEAKSRLFSTTFIISHFQQNSALKYLAETPEAGAMDILVKALWAGLKPGKVREILLSVQDRAKLDRLWQLWAEGRSEKLGALLREKGVPAGDEALRILVWIEVRRAQLIVECRNG